MGLSRVSPGAMCTIRSMGRSQKFGFEWGESEQHNNRSSNRAAAVVGAAWPSGELSISTSA